MGGAFVNLHLLIICVYISSTNSADIAEVPVCETVISCDNLLCDGHGRPPNPTVIVQISDPSRLSWVRYGRTEVIEVVYFQMLSIIVCLFLFFVLIDLHAS